MEARSEKKGNTARCRALMILLAVGVLGVVAAGPAPAQTVSGAVKRPNSDGLAAVEINLNHIVQTSTDINGAFASQTLVAGASYNVKPALPGHRFVPSSVTFTAKAGENFTANFTAVREVRGDFDNAFNPVADISLWRAGQWHVHGSGEIQFGLSSDTPTPGDFDGDGKTDRAVFRPSDGTWHVLNSSDNQYTGLNWGTAGDIPVARDYDGDRKADYAVYRPSTGVWYILNSASSYSMKSFHLGYAGTPAPAYYDDDGKADLAVFSDGNWHIWQSSTDAIIHSQFGTTGDKAVPADYDGDLKADLAVFRPADNTWYISNGNGGWGTLPFGATGDKLAPADYDGDGKTDVAVYRPSIGAWMILQSQMVDLPNPTAFVAFGISSDIPVASYYLPQ
jgi:hypothetical protein